MTMDEVEKILHERLQQLLERFAAQPERRILIALAGTPGSGKSTISSSLIRSFNASNKDQIQVIPMDGFHYPRALLSKMKFPECPFQRRGAPFTFDAEAFVDLVVALGETPVTPTDDPSKAFWVPSFDHATKDPIERDIYIPSSQRIVLLEGSYLLLDMDPWRRIRELVDETWFISVPREIAKQRLIVRHLAAGIESDHNAAAVRAEKNDLLNADLINEKLIRPDVIVY